jgi:phosphoribosylanthranilate isomerase
MLTEVKVCGICRAEDAQLAVELGATAIGFVFWPESPRHIDPDEARSIAAALPDGVLAVGVFVDQPVAEVVEIAGTVRLDAIQLHGHENVAEYEVLSHRVIKALPVGETFDPAAVDALPERVTVLLDAHDPVRRGGTGRTIDWTLAASVAERRETILSGGLNAANVAEAIKQVRPYMVDVSSGVESAPGRKDPDKLRAFFSAIALINSEVTETTEQLRDTRNGSVPFVPSE